MTDDLEAFGATNYSLHAAGLNRNRKAYKQPSNEALVEVFFDLIEEIRAEVAIEIGAFRADFSQRFIASGRGRRALAIEANPFNFNRFKDRLNSDQLAYVHGAVLDREGPFQMQLFDTDIDREQGFIRGNNSLRKRQGHENFTHVEVPGQTLDNLVGEQQENGFLPDLKAAGVIFWIDVEGAMDMVIRGGRNSLSQAVAIFAEVEMTPYWQGQALFPEVARLLAELGFVPVLKDCEYDPDQFNVLFLHKERAVAQLAGTLTDKYQKRLQQVVRDLPEV